MNTTRIAALFLATLLNSAAADEFVLLKEERIGPLRFNQPAAEAKRLITCPVQRGPVELWGADGDYHQAWTAPACVRGCSLTRRHGVHWRQSCTRLSDAP